MQMYLVLKAIFWESVLEDALSILLLIVMLLIVIVRHRARKAEPSREIQEDLKPPREIQEDLEAWRRIQNYSANDAYGTGGGG